MIARKPIDDGFAIRWSGFFSSAPDLRLRKEARRFLSRGLTCPAHLA